MNTEEIIKLARKVGGYDGFTSPPTDWDEGDFVISPEQLSKFATLVRNEALEALKAENEALRAEVERLKGENANLKTVMVAAAEEIHQHWDAHCDAEGYGPTNLMRRLEKGIPSQYGYTAGAFAELRQRADTAEARVAELERFHAVVRTAMQIHVIDEDAIEWINQRLTFLRGEEA